MSNLQKELFKQVREEIKLEGPFTCKKFKGTAVFKVIKANKQSIEGL